MKPELSNIASFYNSNHGVNKTSFSNLGSFLSGNHGINIANYLNLTPFHNGYHVTNGLHIKSKIQNFTSFTKNFQIRVGNLHLSEI